MSKELKNKKHIYRADIIAIFLCLAMAIYSIIVYKKNFLPFFAYYFVMLAFRVVVLLLQMMIVRKNDEPLTKFKKERVLCRFAGVLLIVVDIAFLGILYFGALFKKYDIYQQFPWLLLFYIAYAIYKLVSSIIGFKKSRRGFSPYRDIMSALNLIDSLLTLTIFFGLIEHSYESFMAFRGRITPIALLCIAMAIVSMVITLKIICSRKVPNLLK